jgi:hypothetical protein
MNEWHGTPVGRLLGHRRSTTDTYLKVSENDTQSTFTGGGMQAGAKGGFESLRSAS